jgi:hypothetical protein
LPGLFITPPPNKAHGSVTVFQITLTDGVMFRIKHWRIQGLPT